MKLCVVSDSHMKSGILQEIREKQKECNYFIHCGDSMMDPKSKDLEGYLAVMGNNDFMYDYPEELLLTLEDKRIWVIHGDNHQVKFDRHLDRLFYAAKEKEADLVFFGHTHLERATMIEGTLFINPGSCKYRGINGYPTYAVVDLKPLKVQFFRADTHEIIDEKLFQ